MLERELDTASKKCRHCGSGEHFSNQCPPKPAKDRAGTKWTSVEDEKLKTEINKKLSLKDIAHLTEETRVL